MRSKSGIGRKLRYGSLSIVLTALVIAVVIAVNAIVSMLVQRYTLYIDLTPDYHFTISEDCFDLIGKIDAEDGVDTPIEMLDKFRADNKKYNADNGLTAGMDGYKDENVKVNILFCLERDTLLASSTSEYVVRNAEELQAKYPDHISLEFVNGRRNYSRLSKYLYSNTEKIGLESVIIECGTEFRIRSIESFYVLEGEAPVGYNGEKAFASSILAVTRAETPLACYTVNHREQFPESNSFDANGNKIIPFLASLEDAGYKTQGIDLEKEDIPEECRILVIFDPKSDFLAGNDGISNVSELDKLDDFLADRNALMVFMSPESYDGADGFENLEGFLAEWGLAFRRDGDDPYIVRDTSASIGMTNSAAVVGQFAENPLASGWTASMTSNTTSNPKVVFPNSVALTYANGYNRAVIENETDETKSYTIGYSATYNRTVFDLFVTSENAKAWAGDREIAAATKTDPLKLMAISVQTYVEQEHLGALEDSAYVMLCGSTDFATDTAINSNGYGNSDFLLAAFQMSGRDPVPVGLKYKEFANYAIESIEAGEATQYTIALTLTPIIVTLAVGIFVIVRRKYR